ncbi:hypothetical protein DY000_02037772 [Brassica cretica]|uniref:ACT domain-containing protein ACR n=1 Tax=Brassica cretica TaxID=69181 RepID=A0ABQ7BKQ0_BRACR|nr:hypothetical protein DY000_02037772 [Brassica cretica]
MNKATSTPSPSYIRWCYIVFWVSPDNGSSRFDWEGLLHDVTKVLIVLEFTIQRVKVTTTPDGRVLDMFFITDAMDLLHSKQRQSKTCDHLTVVFGEHGVSCEIELAGPELESLQRFSSLPPEAADELFGSDISSISNKVVLTTRLDIFLEDVSGRLQALSKRTGDEFNSEPLVDEY